MIGIEAKGSGDVNGKCHRVILYIAIEHGPVEIIDFPIKNGDVPWFCVCLPQVDVVLSPMDAYEVDILEKGLPRTAGASKGQWCTTFKNDDIFGYIPVNNGA